MVWCWLLWVEETSQFNEYFIKNCNEDSIIGFLIEVYVQYAEKLLNLDNDLLFYPGRIKIENVVKLIAYLHDK